MRRSTFLRILEAFFQRWYLYIIPLVLFIVVGLVGVETRETFTSRASMFVDSESLVTTRSGVQDGGLGSFLTPAQFASQELDGLIQTDVFMESVLVSVGIDIEGRRTLGLDPLEEARASLSTRETSENLVQITATTDGPVLSQRLATATIEEYVEFKIALDIAESEASETFFAALATDYQRQAAEARAAVDAFLAANGAVTAEDITLDSQTELTRLSEGEALAEARYLQTVDDVEASRLASLQAETDVRQSFSIVDPAQLPARGDSSSFDDVVTLFTYAIAGMILTLVGPVIVAMLNRAVLFPEDIEHIAGVRVVAVVPRSSRREVSLSRAVIPELDPFARLVPDQPEGDRADGAEESKPARSSHG